MMQDMPHDVFALFSLAFAFGLKHGLDPDHLATIDGLARYNATAKPWLSRWAGVLFSLGHGLVVITAVEVIALLPGRIALPQWLEGLGMAVSIFTLLLLGVLNMYAAFNTRQATHPIGLKGWMHFQSGHPAIVLGIGALFALSFDTMSQAAFFSLAANNISFELYAFTLGVVFTLGMIVSDGLSGMLTARCIKQAGKRALLASRIMSLVIGSVSLFVAALGILRWLQPANLEANELFAYWPVIAIVLWVLAGFVLSLFVARFAVKVKWMRNL
jgi:nickel/cobalt transporter (NiCoT) family protein